MSDEQSNYRINEILRLVTNLVEQGQEHSAILKEHSAILKDHSSILKEQGQKLDNLTGKVDVMSGQLGGGVKKVISHEERLTVAEKNISVLQDSIH